MLWGSGKGKTEGKIMSLAGNAGSELIHSSVWCVHTLLHQSAWSCIFSAVLRISQNNSLSKVTTMDYCLTFSFWQMFLLAATSMALEYGAEHPPKMYGFLQPCSF